MTNPTGFSSLDIPLVSEPPCRDCGSSRAEHGTTFNHDHRYKAERYYHRCQCRAGDHNLDGTPDHCLKNAGKGHRLCSDCRSGR